VKAPDHTSQRQSSSYSLPWEPDTSPNYIFLAYLNSRKHPLPLAHCIKSVPRCDIRPTDNCSASEHLHIKVCDRSFYLKLKKKQRKSPLKFNGEWFNSLPSSPVLFLSSPYLFRFFISFLHSSPIHFLVNRMWIGFIWLRTGTGGALLCTR
jgi:hypothetical protein